MNKKEYGKKWREEHPEYMKENYQMHKKERKEYYREYYQEHKEERKGYNKEWQEKNPGRVKEVNKKASKKYAGNNSKKIKARNITSYHLKHLKQPFKEFHHQNYNEPLNVVVMPLAEHRALHVQLNNQIQLNK